MKNDTSPFAEKSWQEQQDKWREWRSMQLEYKQAEDYSQQQKEEPARPEPPPVRPAPTRHRELDKVLSRHRTAVNRVGAFQQMPSKEMHCGPADG